MANLPETASFDSVYQLEDGDFVDAGTAGDGTSNKQAVALTNRTKYLKVHVDAIENEYKKYAANLTQSSSSAPAVTVLGTNGIGAIVWARAISGSYTGTLSGAFTSAKTLCFISGIIGGNARIKRINNNQVEIITKDLSDTAADTLLSETAIEIRVYP